MFHKRCRAVKEKARGDIYWGRCDLDRDHEGLHELERGFDSVYWSTREYIIDPVVDNNMGQTLALIVDSGTDYPPFIPIVVDQLLHYFDTQYRAERAQAYTGNE